jgi:subtilase family serine protease
MSRRSRLTSRPSLEQLEGRLVPAAMTPADLQAAYGLSSLTLDGATLNGASQTIAIIDAYNDPYAQLELAVFDEEWGLPTANLTVDNLGSATNTNAGWEGEEALDIETAHLAAPGANIVLVEAQSDSLTDLMNAVNTASSLPGVTIVSMSWGEGDSRSETAYNADFNHAGITYLAASGDEGAGAEWPADSPYVIGVGGTSLTLSSTGAITSQSAWEDSSGGVSRVEAEPSYQDVAQQTGDRTTPDVSADANPNDGLIVISVAAGGWVEVGGTSLATPLWAGLIADANEGRFIEDKPPLDSTEALEDLYNAPAGSFNDITTGARATVSYDTSTGLGTPNATVLAAALVGDPATSGSTTGNGVGGDPLPVPGQGVTTNPFGPPFFEEADQVAPVRQYVLDTPGSYSEATGTWAVAGVPANSGQDAPDPYSPIVLIQDDQSSTETTPRVTQATPQPATPTGITNPQTSTQAVSDYRVVAAALESLGRDDY